MRQEHKPIGISVWSSTETMGKKLSITFVSQLLISLGKLFMTKLLNWTFMKWRRLPHAYCWCVLKRKVYSRSSIATIDAKSWTWWPSPRTTTCCRNMGEQSGNVASGMQVTARSSLGPARADHHGIDWTKTWVSWRHTAFGRRQICTGRCGKSSLSVFNMFMSWTHWHYSNFLEDVTIGMMLAWCRWFMEHSLISTTLMDACMDWNHNSKMLGLQSRNRGELSHGG